MPATGTKAPDSRVKMLCSWIEDPGWGGLRLEVVQRVVPIVLLSLVNFASSVLSDETKSNQEEAPMKKTLKVKLFLFSPTSNT